MNQLRNFLAASIASGECCVIEPSGTVWERPPEYGNEYLLSELQEIVQGHIEILRAPEVDFLMVINEEGKLVPLPARNSLATEIAHAFNLIFLQDYIAGPALVCPKSFIS